MTVTSLTGMAVPRGPRWPALAFFAAMAAAGPLMDGFWQSLLTLVFFYAFMGLTWNLMMSAGLLSLGHALFLGLGAYATAVFTVAGGLSPWLAIAAGAFIAAVRRQCADLDGRALFGEGSAVRAADNCVR